MAKREFQMTCWDEVLKRPKYGSVEPFGSVVELVPILERRSVKRVLDLGCGPGRHLVYLSKCGFDMYGVDISDFGLKKARRRLRQAGLKAELKKSDITTLPYLDGFFGAVISFWVIYHNTLISMRKTISEVYRVLNKDGLAFLTFQSMRSYKYKTGKEVGTNTFLLDEGPEKGILHHFSDREEVERLLTNFNVLRLNLDEFTDEMDNLNSHWEVLAEKMGITCMKQGKR
jgi:SAM-dependent methyltransferase